MKKKLTVLLALLLVLVACSKPAQENGTETTTESTRELKTIKVASHTNPMTDILELVAPDLEEKGYKLELVKVTDNVQANVALNNKEVDANFFQHEPFMKQFNEGNNGTLVKLTPVYNAIVSFYGKDIKDIKDLKDGAIVAIPNDTTNLDRALKLLAKSGLIEIDKEFGLTLDNVVSNPKNLQFKEWGLLNLNEAYNESDIVFNYPTYIEALGLTPLENGLLFEEDNDTTYAITVAAREDNKDSEEMKSLKEVMTSEKVREFINDKLKGHAVPAF